MKPKAYRAKNGRHYIEKRVVSRVDAQLIFEAALSYAFEKISRKSVLDIAAENNLTEHAFDWGLDRFCDQWRIDEFRERCDKCFELCLDLFPDIPIEEFIEAKLTTFSSQTETCYETGDHLK